MGEEKMRARLSGSAALVAIVGAKIYAGRAPQNTASPFVIWQRVSGFQDQVLDGLTDLVTGRFQVDCYAATYDDAKRMARAVAAAVQQNDGDLEAYLEGNRDIFDDDLPNFFRRSMDFMTMERVNDGG